jgi:hypothetical protein
MKKEPSMKNRSIAKALLAGFAFAGLLIGLIACTMGINNEVSAPDDLFPHKGRLVIHNSSASQSILSILVEEGETSTQIARDTSELPPGTDRLFILNPGRYWVRVSYAEGLIQPEAELIQVEYKKTVTYRFNAETGDLEVDNGFLRIVNFSGAPLNSVELLGVGLEEAEELLTSPVPDSRLRSFERGTGNYTLTVKNDRPREYPAENVTLFTDEVTDILVFEDGIVPGGPGISRENLWVLNRSGTIVTLVEEQQKDTTTWTPLLDSAETIPAGARYGFTRPEGEYNIQVTIQGQAPFTGTYELIRGSPVFVIVDDSGITLIFGLALEGSPAGNDAVTVVVAP